MKSKHIYNIKSLSKCRIHDYKEIKFRQNIVFEPFLNLQFMNINNIYEYGRYVYNISINDNNELVFTSTHWREYDGGKIKLKKFKNKNLLQILSIFKSKGFVPILKTLVRTIDYNYFDKVLYHGNFVDDFSYYNKRVLNNYESVDFWFEL